MNIWDILILLLIALSVWMAFRRIHSGKAGSCNCTSCASCDQCSQCRKEGGLS
ncbi:MAG: FeoB-associated Cys-rich membrane protein [Clostridia bacterium]|nr:FeoB-associated Cys-rich membrane protein [Clostridia bacterium]